jgi:dihydroorotate dehydrogenase
MPVKALGLEFPNPVGLAAGLDKNGATSTRWRAGLRLRRGRHHHAAAAAGQPEAAHVPAASHKAVINRLGFNNEGVDALVRNVERAAASAGCWASTSARTRTRRTSARFDDYLYCLERVYPRPTTSPSTSPRPTPPACATCRRAGAAAPARHAARGAGAAGRQARQRVPMLVKVAPDLSDDEIERMAPCSLRPAGRRRHRHQHHGLALPVEGHRHAQGSRRAVRRAAVRPLHLGAAPAALAPAASIPLIGVGGILTAPMRSARSPPARTLVQSTPA